jgi:hypothetical protein
MTKNAFTFLMYLTESIEFVNLMNAQVSSKSDILSNILVLLN